jgi:hypothetical protein
MGRKLSRASGETLRGDNVFRGTLLPNGLRTTEAAKRDKREGGWSEHDLYDLSLFFGDTITSQVHENQEHRGDQSNCSARHSSNVPRMTC